MRSFLRCFGRIKPAAYGDRPAAASELRRRTDEFSAESPAACAKGSCCLIERGYVLSINAAAKEIFGADDGSAGQDFLTIDRSSAMSGASAGGHARRPRGDTFRARRAGVTSFDLTRIESGGRSIGTVILAFDMTEQEQAERMRREFTANVSHQAARLRCRASSAARSLSKTALSKPEDVPRFVGHIHSEASRLMALISDIIRLSQLDEGAEMPRESVDSYDEAGREPKRTCARRRRKRA